jgi:ADP-ribosylglycohydrolase
VPGRRHLPDRATAGLVGAVVGDALGAATQYMTPAAVRAVHGRVTEVLGGGVHQWRPGEPTAVGVHVVAGAFGPGTLPDSRDTRSPTALARVLGAALAGHDARAAAALTDTTRVTLDAATALAAVVTRLLAGAAADDAVQEVAQDAPIRKSVRELVTAGLDDDVAFDAHPLTVAVWGVVRAEPYEVTVLEIVNRGGDANLHAALAGGLVALRDGRDSVPARWQGTELVAVLDAG